jgi:hypothetical protein
MASGTAGTRAKPVPNLESMGPTHRLKIANSNVLKYLINHAEGKKKMEPTQVTAAIALLKKVLPDLSSIDQKTEHSVDDGLDAVIRYAAQNAKRAVDFE